MTAPFHHTRVSPTGRKALAVWLAVCLVLVSLSMQAIALAESPLDCCGGHATAEASSDAAASDHEPCLQCEHIACSCQLAPSALAGYGGDACFTATADTRAHCWTAEPYLPPLLDRPAKPPKA